MMSQGTSGGPQLVVLGNGPLCGRRYSLQSGAMLIGRGGDAGLVLQVDDLSRRHAWIRWDGRTASIADAGSRNGTSVNGHAVHEARELRDGDVVRLGSLRLRYQSPGAAGERPTAADLSVAGHGVRNDVGGTASGDVQAGRDVDNHDPMDELSRRRDLGRALVVLGMIAALAGFAGWAYIIFHSDQIGDPGYNPFDQRLAGLPAEMIAFGAFAAGGVLASVGQRMSRVASRRRDELVRTVRS